MMRLYAQFLVFLWIVGIGSAPAWAIPFQSQGSVRAQKNCACVLGKRCLLAKRFCRVSLGVKGSKKARIDLSFQAIPKRWDRSRYRWVVKRASLSRQARRPRRVAKVPAAKSVRKARAVKRRNARFRKARVKVAQKSAGQTSLALPPGLPPRFDAKQPQITLKKLFSMVRKNSLDLRILRERVVQAELARAKAWAILKPQLSVNASYTRNEVEAKLDPTASIRAIGNQLPEPFRSQLLGGLGNSEPVVISPRDQLNFRMQLQWAFFNLQAIPVLQIAYLAVSQVGHTAKQVRREVLFATARAYYGVLLADGLVDITRRSWKNSRDRLRISIARYKAGVDPELLVTRAQLDLAKARQSWIQAQNGLRNAKLAIALILNRPHFRFRPQRPSRPVLPTGSTNDWFKQAKSSRSELKSARIAVNIANKQITSVWTKFVPTVAVVGTVNGSNAAGFGGQNVMWSVTLAATMNLYSGGTRYIELKEAHSKYRQARLEYAKSRRTILNEIAQGKLALQNAKVALQVAKKQLGLARRGYQLTQERYKTGVATPVEVSDALTGLRSAEVGVLREALNQELAILSIQRAVGLFPSK